MEALSKNQVHLPIKKRRRVDSNGNECKKMWLKEGTSTMLFVDGLTANGCKALINHINSFLISCGLKALPNNKFLITQ